MTPASFSIAVDLGRSRARAAQSAMMPSISSWLIAARKVRREPRVVGELGLPIASQRRRKTLSAFAAITIHLPSLDLKMFEGAMPFRLVPAGLAHDLQPVVFRNRALEHREAGLEQRHVDDLALPPPSASRQ